MAETVTELFNLIVKQTLSILNHNSNNSIIARQIIKVEKL